MKITFESAEEKAKKLEEVSNVSGASCKLLYLADLEASEVSGGSEEEKVDADSETEGESKSVTRRKRASTK